MRRLLTNKCLSIALSETKNNLTQMSLLQWVMLEMINENVSLELLIKYLSKYTLKYI